MIQLERRQAARFRAAVRRCVVGRPRGLAPPVVLQQSKDGLALSAVLEETVLSLCLPGAGGPAERLVVPMTTLAALEGPGGGVATFEETDGGVVRCRWQERGESKDVGCEAVPADQQPPPPPPVGKLHAVNPVLVTALHACGQSANRETTSRFALARLQLRGQVGQVIGTDGRQLLIWGGLELPFQEDLLVPAVPVFGSRDFTGEEDVHIGRTNKYVNVTVGPWTVWLAIDDTSRFPDVTSVLPRSSRMAKLVLDEADATALLRDLQEALPAGDEVVPVVLEFGPRPALRWREGTPGQRGPINLSRSTCTGPTLAVMLDPKFLVRALSLGFREVCGTSGNAPVLFRDHYRSYLVANFGQAPAAASPDRPALPAPRSTNLLPPAGSGVASDDVGASPVPEPVCPLSQQGEAPVDSERNGGPPTNHPLADDVLDPLTEAEALRAALAEAGRRVSRLMVSLRQFQKQRRVLHSAWNSLRHLGLGTKEEL